MFNKPEIIDFIKNFKRGHNEYELINTFTNGNCFHFATILKALYPGGHIAYSQTVGHFAYCINRKTYDITGEINLPDAIEFSREEDSRLYDRLLRDCVYKIT